MQKEKIYRIAYAYEGEETGATPQVAFEKGLIEDQLFKSLRRKTVKEISVLSESLPNLLVYEESKLTDFLSIMDMSMARGKLISKRLYHELKKLTLTNEISTKFNVIDKIEKHQYYYIDISSIEIEDFIVFKNSIFKEVPGNKAVKIDNAKEFEVEIKKLYASYLRWHRLSLRSDVFKKFDIFSINFGDSQWYGNSKAKEVLERFSGLMIEEAKDIVLV